DRLIVSPLVRSRRSGEIVRAALGEKPAVEVVEAFREINFGAWEGWTFAEAAQRDPENFARRASEGEAFGFPGGETRAGFYARVATAITSERFATNRRTLVVVHKGIIKILIRKLCGLSAKQASELPVSLGSIHRLRPRGEGWVVVAGNQTRHLGDLDIGG
ncbi:MAG: histidine phosphatase family protein, partial [Nannocystaceae bacterium]